MSESSDPPNNKSDDGAARNQDAQKQAPKTLPRRSRRRMPSGSAVDPNQPLPELADSAPPASQPASQPEAGSESADPAEGASRTKRWPPKRIAKVAAITLASAGLLSILFVVVLFWYYSRDLPSVEQLKAGYDPPQVTRILARDKTLLASVFTERRTVIPFDTVPDAAKLAFLAAEDAMFYEHEGLDYAGIVRAMWSNLRSGKTRQGGSTITQQVVKNVLLDPERTYRRKIRETLLARRLEQYLEKDEIFGLYLNHIYLGHGRYGIEEAARYYFGKHARELTLDESALLAGLVAAPERYSPRRDVERALARRTYVLNQMVEKRFVTQALARKAHDAPVRLAPAIDAESELAPEIVGIVKRQLRELGKSNGSEQGLVIHTTIDPELQAAARRAVRENLHNYAKRQKFTPPFTLEKRRLWGEQFQGTPKVHRIYTGRVVARQDQDGTLDVRVGDVVGQVDLKQEDRYNAGRLPPSEFAKVGAALRVRLLEEPEAGRKPRLRLELGPQSALIALDVRSREVLALVGSYEALMGGLDRATQSKRQPGSTFKPFVYSYALHSRRFTPASMLKLSRPVRGLDKSRIRVRQALARSVNEAAIILLRESGPANIVEWAHALGIESKLGADESLALGAYEVTPLEMASSYAVFASGGRFEPPRFIHDVQTASGQALQLPPHPPGRDPLTPAEAYLTTSLLQSVVQEGTAKAARRLKRPVAGKTGTTNLKRGDRRTKDAWFVGYSTDMVVAVWVGYDDSLPLGYGESGAATALPAWINFMKAGHEGRPATDFPMPKDLETVPIDPATGLLAYPGQSGAIDELFLSGTVPEEVATPDAGAGSASRSGSGVDAGMPLEVEPDFDMVDPIGPREAPQPEGNPAMGGGPAELDPLPPF